MINNKQLEKKLQQKDVKLRKHRKN